MLRAGLRAGCAHARHDARAPARLPRSGRACLRWARLCARGRGCAALERIGGRDGILVFSGAEMIFSALGFVAPQVFPESGAEGPALGNVCFVFRIFINLGLIWGPRYLSGGSPEWSQSPPRGPRRDPRALPEGFRGAPGTPGGMEVFVLYNFSICSRYFRIGEKHYGLDP